MLNKVRVPVCTVNIVIWVPEFQFIEMTYRQGESLLKFSIEILMLKFVFFCHVVIP